MLILTVLIMMAGDTLDTSVPARLSPPSSTGAVVTTIGSAALATGALVFKLSADGSYGDYKNARSTAEAVDFRDRTEKYDKLAAWTMIGAGAVAVTTVILWVRYETLLGRHKRAAGMKASLKKEGLCFGGYARF